MGVENREQAPGSKGPGTSEAKEQGSGTGGQGSGTPMPRGSERIFRHIPGMTPQWDKEIKK